LQGGESTGGGSGRVYSRSRTDEPHIGKYKLLKTIGKGNFAKVKLAKHVLTDKEVSTVPANGATSGIRTPQGAGNFTFVKISGGYRDLAKNFKEKIGPKI